MDQLKTMVVEDEHITALDISRMLERAGYAVTALASTGERAIQKVAETAPDVVLMDIKLKGDMDGISTAAIIRDQFDLPIIYLTAYSDDATLERAKLTSPYGYLLKPINEKELHATVETTLYRHKMEVELRQRNRELSLLNKIISASATSIEPEEFLKIACFELANGFDLPVAAALSYNKNNQMVTVIAQQNRINQPTVLNQSFPIKSDGLLTSIIQNKTPLVVPDIQNEPKLARFQKLLKQHTISSLLLLPLAVQNEVIGLLILGAIVKYHFSASQIELGQVVAEQIGGALNRVRLQKRQSQLSAAFEQTAETVIVTDIHGDIVYVNPAFEKVTGYSQEEALGNNPNILKSGKHTPEFYKEMWLTIQNGQVWQGRITNRKKDGSLFIENATITPVRNERGNIVNYVAVKRDVTRELQLEEQYQQAQKMEAIGLLAGGIAHDFNNILTAMNGFADLLEFELPADSEEQELARKIGDGVRRAAELVRQLLAFSRKQIIEPKTLNLNDIYENFEKFISRVIGENIQLETSFAPGLWLIKADPGQLEQIFLNLAVNARDAMPDGGKLTIETANVILVDDDLTRQFELEAGEFVMLTISDVGHGMSDEVKSRIFEPFYTTKEVGKGTGLGLATVYGIVKQNHGAISVSSKNGNGTAFRIYFPRSEEAVIPEPKPRKTIRSTHGNATILLVEDDNEVCRYVAEVLKLQGYKVLEAANGYEAMELADEYAGHINLLLTDVIMPGITGKELANRLQEKQPGLKVLFMTGYPQDMIARHGVLEPNVTFIEKPFRPAALTHIVKQVLETS